MLFLALWSSASCPLLGKARELHRTDWHWLGEAMKNDKIGQEALDVFEIKKHTGLGNGGLVTLGVCLGRVFILFGWSLLFI